MSKICLCYGSFWYKYSLIIFWELRFTTIIELIGPYMHTHTIYIRLTFIRFHTSLFISFLKLLNTTYLYINYWYSCKPLQLCLILLHWPILHTATGAYLPTHNTYCNYCVTHIHVQFHYRSLTYLYVITSIILLDDST